MVASLNRTLIGLGELGEALPIRGVVFAGVASISLGMNPSNILTIRANCRSMFSCRASALVSTVCITSANRRSRSSWSACAALSAFLPSAVIRSFINSIRAWS